VIDVAASPEKRKHESKMIAATVIQKTQRLCPSLGDVALPVGILGTGAVGAALAGKLAQSEDSVRCYSPDWNVSEWTPACATMSVKEILEQLPKLTPEERQKASGLASCLRVS
jgi:hypothetical protein